MSLIDTIKSAAPQAGQRVTIDQWAVTVLVRQMSLRKRADAYEHAQLNGEVTTDRLYPALIIASVCDPDSGTPIFGWDDMDFLAEQPADIIEPLGQMCMIKSHLTVEAVEAGKDDSSSIPNDTSTSS